MGYTRYDLRRKKKHNYSYIILICGVLVLAFISGSIISKLFIKDINSEESNSLKNQNNIVQPVGEKSFIAIQGGVFANKENAEKLKISLSVYGNPFIVSENGKNRVILGIYTEKESEEIINKLKGNNIEFSKISFKYDLSNPCNLQIAETIDAQLQIIEKLSEDNVKSVQTKQLKKWCNDLKSVDENEANYNTLIDLKEHIKKLPDEITKDSLEEYNIYLYKKLKEVNV